MFVFVEGTQLNEVVPIVPVMFVVNAIEGALFEQIVVGVGFAAAVGIGFTVITNVSGVPKHAVAVDKDGVTLMFAVMGDVPELVARNERISPEPLATKPIDILSFVQAKLVPATAPVKLMAFVLTLLQYVKSVGRITVGAGFTVTVAVVVVPGQPTLLLEKVGVMV
jgi:hypothetical protein